jgi:hypothetical protein
MLRRWCAALSSVGIFLTFLFVPEPLRVPLAELDRRYAYHQAGKVYHGAFTIPVRPRSIGKLARSATLRLQHVTAAAGQNEVRHQS